MPRLQQERKCKGHESEIIREANLLQVQGGPAPGNRKGPVRQSSAQATAGLTQALRRTRYGTHRRGRSSARKADSHRPDLYLWDRAAAGGADSEEGRGDRTDPRQGLAGGRGRQVARTYRAREGGRRPTERSVDEHQTLGG